jgi:hypothetical protein
MPPGRRTAGSRLARASFRGGAMVFCLVAACRCGYGEEVAALYQAYWAGLPAGEIRLTLRDDADAYRGDIAIRSEGLPRLVTRFRGSAAATGRLAAGQLPAPLRYEALYDLRQGRDKRLSMVFTRQGDAAVAERGPADTSKKPPLPEIFRRNVLDPLSALTAIRERLRRGDRGAFSVPVYDGARRFDVLVQVRPKRGPDAALDLVLTLAPIAGFKGETSDDGDPDNAPRPVALRISDDRWLMPLSMSVSVYYLPLVVEWRRRCDAQAPCGW